MSVTKRPLIYLKLEPKKCLSQEWMLDPLHETQNFMPWFTGRVTTYLGLPLSWQNYLFSFSLWKTLIFRATPLNSILRTFIGCLHGKSSSSFWWHHFPVWSLLLILLMTQSICEVAPLTHSLLLSMTFWNSLLSLWAKLCRTGVEPRQGMEPSRCEATDLRPGLGSLRAWSLASG